MSGIPLWIVASLLSGFAAGRQMKSSSAINTLAPLITAPIVRSGVRMKRTTTCDDPAASGTSDLGRFPGLLWNHARHHSPSHCHAG